MSDDSDVEKTEQATPKRISEAREKGSIPRSKDLSVFASLIMGISLLMGMGHQMLADLLRLMRQGLTLDRQLALDPHQMGIRLQDFFSDALLSVLPFLGGMLLVDFTIPIAVGGWLFSTTLLAPDFARLDPIKGLTRIVSVNGLVEMGNAVLKTVLVGVVSVWALSHDLDAVLALSRRPLHAALGHVWEVLTFTLLVSVSSLALLAAIDVPYQLWHYNEQLKMSKDEIKQEYKESEGSPEVKGKIKQLQREAARRRMMSEIPKADVIVTNPTHFAVALQYQDSDMGAPKVVAKGAQLLAQRIIEIGKENQVPILRTPPLARALYKHAELGSEIPAALYSAVAQVLAYIYQLKHYRTHGGFEPKIPETIDVPAELDPGPLAR